MNWLAYALATVVFYSLFDYFLKLSVGKLHDGTAGFIINLVSALVLVVFMIYSRSTGEAIWPPKPGGVMYAVVAGLAIGVATITFIKMYATGTNLSVGVPIIRIGTVVLASILGIVLLKEGISVKYVIGSVVSLVGFYIMLGK